MTARLRRFLRFALAGLFYYSGAFWLWRYIRQRLLGKKEVCALGFHRVLTKAEQSRSNSLDGMVLSDVTFVRLLGYLQQRFRVVPLETFFRGQTEEADKSRPWCLLTFDDGWRDTYTTAYPWLKKLGMPATVFLATGSIEGRGGFWVEQLKRSWRIPSSRAQMKSVLSQVSAQNRCQVVDLEDIVEWLKHMPTEKRHSLLGRLLAPEANGDSSDEVDSMLTWNQVIEMSQNGMEIGAHTVNHPLLSYESDTTVERELCISKQTLEEKLGKKVHTFAYPNGDWDERVRLWVEQIGYESAFTTRPGWHRFGQDRYTIRRILLHEGNVTGPDGQFSPAMLNWTLAGWH
jgi:peptidoglycan/xylan/chitin deacetylase (PgdA/CDA1 family)